MITKEQIKKCKKHCHKNGYDVSIEDISYLLLNREYRDIELAYSLVFHVELSFEEVSTYDKSEKMTVLRGYMNENWVKRPDVVSCEEISGEISFEENRDALIQYLNDIQKMMNARQIDAKDGMKMMTDIRLKLNDKFNIKEQQVEQRVVVQPKFNHICQHTHKECWLQTKDYAMSHWHLIPDPDWTDK